MLVALSGFRALGAQLLSCSPIPAGAFLGALVGRRLGYAEACHSRETQPTLEHMLTHGACSSTDVHAAARCYM